MQDARRTDTVRHVGSFEPRRRHGGAGVGAAKTAEATACYDKKKKKKSKQATTTATTHNNKLNAKGGTRSNAVPRHSEVHRTGRGPGTCHATEQENDLFLARRCSSLGHFVTRHTPSLFAETLTLKKYVCIYTYMPDDVGSESVLRRFLRSASRSASRSVARHFFFAKTPSPFFDAHARRTGWDTHTKPDG